MWPHSDTAFIPGHYGCPLMGEWVFGRPYSIVPEVNTDEDLLTVIFHKSNL